MMSELFDEEYLRQQYDKAERKKSFAEGESKAIKNIADKLREMGLSDEQIKKATSIQKLRANRFLKSVSFFNLKYEPNTADFVNNL